MFVFFVGLIIVWSISQQLAQLTSAESPEKSMLLTQHLKEIAVKYDCYFTLEVGLESGNVTDSLEGRNVAIWVQQEGLGQELEWLRNTVPNFTYEVDAYNSKIIHVIDARLAKESSYAMGEIVDSISFEGSVFDLVNAIGQKGIAVSSRVFVDTRKLGLIDSSTNVSIAEKKKSVRNILTNSVALKGRARILWIATTEVGNKQTSYIRYMNRLF